MLMGSDKSLCQLLEALNLGLELVQLRVQPLLLPELHLQHVGRVPHGSHARQAGLHPLQPYLQVQLLLFEVLLLFVHVSSSVEKPAAPCHISGHSHFLPKGRLPLDEINV